MSAITKIATRKTGQGATASQNIDLPAVTLPTKPQRTESRAPATGQSAAALHAKPQVTPDHYLGDYLNLPRMITYWYQATAVRNCAGPNVLEVGTGMGLTSWILRRWGLRVTELDLDPALRPTCAGDVRAMPFAADSFDTILIAEVLEHLPFEEFAVCLADLRRVTKRHVVVTLPCPLVGVHVGINLPLWEPLFVALGVRQLSQPRFDGQHYWELDRRGYPKRRIRRAILEAGFEIAKEFRPGLSLYNYFFVLAKQ